jgi:hypothetical protein
MMQGMRSRRFFHKKSSTEGVTVFDQTFVKSLRVRNALRVGLQFLVAKMDGVAVVHDEFRGMGRAGVCGGGGGAGG